MPVFQPRALFGKRVVEKPELCCGICGACAPVADFKHPNHPITESVCAGCWDKAAGWCFDCAIPLEQCRRTP